VKRALACVALLAATPAAGAAAPDWSGTWQGTLVNYPGRAGAPAKSVTVIREIGPTPTRSGECTTFRTTYSEEGKIAGVKDYRLCRGAADDEYVIDEGTVPEGRDVRLTSRLLGDVLVSAFKVRGTTLFTAMRRDGDELVDDIYVLEERAGDDGVVSLPVRSLQRLRLRLVRPTVP
jgi:hypothetical protein